MTRIQPSAAHAALDQAARRITDAAGDDAKVSKAELKAAVAELSGTEKKLVDVFSRFVTNRAGRPAEGLSERDVQEAVAYAKASMISKYDLDGDGLSPDEVKKMSKTGQLAVKLAEELELGGSGELPPLTTGGESWFELRERVTVDSRVKITDPAGIDLTRAEQIVAACRNAAYPEVQTLADAFAAVDMGEFAITEFTDPASGRSYVGVDFGAGDSTYGAIFEAGSATVAYGIQDNSVELPSPAEPTPPKGGPVAPGESWYELKQRAEIVTRDELTDVTDIEFLLGQQLVAATRQSTHKNVTTPEEALAAVDEGGFVITRFNDPKTREQFIAIDYGAGDSTYGAIFKTYSSKATFGIHDGEIALPSPDVGLNTGDDWNDVLARSEVKSRETLTDVTGLDALLLGEQIVAAVHQSTYTHVTTAAEALAAVDEGGFQVTHFNDVQTGKQYIGIDYGAGDNTYGAIFEADSGRPTYAIRDGELGPPRKPVGKPITSGGETFGDVLDRVELLSRSTITDPSGVVDDLQAQQLLIAARLGLFSKPETLEAAFRDIDFGGFEVREFIDPASGTSYVSVDFGAGGGNTFGAIFESGSTEIAIAIIDGLMEE